MATPTKSEMRSLINDLMANPNVKAMIEARIDVSKLAVVRGKTNPQILAEYMVEHGLSSRIELMRALGFDGADEEPNSEAYRLASRNLSSILNAVKKEHQLFEYDGEYAILDEEQQTAFAVFVESLRK